MPSVQSDDRRSEVRLPTSFFAVQLATTGEPRMRYRLVKDLSLNGFAVDDRAPDEQIGDRILMEFPLPGSTQPVRVDGKVVYAAAERGIGVRIIEADRGRYAQLLDSPPPIR